MKSTFLILSFCVSLVSVLAKKREAGKEAQFLNNYNPSIWSAWTETTLPSLLGQSVHSYECFKKKKSPTDAALGVTFEWSW